MAGFFEKLKRRVNRKKYIEADKAAIRHRIRNRKETLSDAEKQEYANAVYEKLEKLPEFIQSTTILLYWSLSDELPTHRFIEKWSGLKQILLPVVKGEEMLIKPFTTTEELRKGEMGIWEPAAQQEFVAKIDLVIIPGVAFDKQKNRMGRGKGYYDRYLANKTIYKIGIAYDFQLLETVPTDEHDIALDAIITPGYSII